MRKDMSLSSYIPEILLEQLAKQKIELTDKDIHLLQRNFNGVVLFTDISGFTSLSESLAKEGKKGTEQLSDILNEYFTIIIQIIRKYGGSIVKFGGDSLTIIFTGEPELALCLSITCVMEMFRKMEKFHNIQTLAGIHNLEISAGLSYGKIKSFVVGTEKYGMEYVVAGKPTEWSAFAQHNAEVGQAILYCENSEFISNIITYKKIKDKLYRILSLKKEMRIPIKLPQKYREEIKPKNLKQYSSSINGSANLQYLFPKSVFNSVINNKYFIGEHREVSILFLQFLNLSEQDELYYQKFQNFIKAVQEIVYSHNGIINKIDIGDKGNKVLIAFGAPVKTEFDEENAIQTALSIQKLKVGNLQVKIGLTSGIAYTGITGSPQRKEYTFIGDSVNTSARLMTISKTGQTIFSENLKDKIAHRYQIIPQGKVKVKGKKQTVNIYSVGKRLERGIADLQRLYHNKSMIGRKEELNRCKESLKKIRELSPQLFIITGEAGIGKSMFNASLIQSADELGFNLHSIEGDRYYKNTPYLPFKKLLWHILNIEENSSDKQIIHCIDELKYKYNIKLELSYIKDFLCEKNLDVSNTDQMGEQIINLITELLLQIWENEPRNHTKKEKNDKHFLSVEDFQWLDKGSVKILNRLIFSCREQKLAISVVSREDEQLKELHYKPTIMLNLSSFSEPEIEQFIKHKLNLIEIPIKLKQTIQNVCAGNPFYVDEFLQMLIDKGLLEQDKITGSYSITRNLNDVEIPNTIQGILLSRIDQLDIETQNVLKVASVVGRNFRLSVIKSVEKDMPIKALKERFFNLDTAELIVLETPIPELEYIFKHIMTKDAVYETLLYKERERLHGQIAKYYEKTYSKVLHNWYEIIAIHYFNSKYKDKAKKYLQLAADKSASQFAYDSAVYFLEKALSLSKEKDIDIALKLAYYQLLSGNVSDAEKIISQTSLEQDISKVKKLSSISKRYYLKTKSQIFQKHGQFKEGVRYIDTVLFPLAEHKDTKYSLLIDKYIMLKELGKFEELERDIKDKLDKLGNQSNWYVGDLHKILADIYRLQAKYNDAIRHFNISLKIAEKNNNLLQKRHAYDNLGNVYSSIGDNRKALQFFNKALALAEKIGDIHSLARTYGNIGIIHYLKGEYDIAEKYYKLYESTCYKIEDKEGLALVYNNFGNIYLDKNNLDKADEYFHKSIVYAKIVGDIALEGRVSGNLGDVEYRRKNYENARNYYQKDLDIAKKLGDKQGIAHVYGNFANIANDIGNYEEAKKHYNLQIKISEEIGDKKSSGTAYYNLGILLETIKQYNDAIQSYTKASAIFQEIDFALGIKYAENNIENIKAQMKSNT